MVSSMDVQPTKQTCDSRIILSQSAVSQKSIDLNLSPKSNEPAGNGEAESADLSVLTSSEQQNQVVVSSNSISSNLSTLTTTLVAVSPAMSTISNVIAGKSNVTDTDLAKRAMKLDLIDTSSNPVRSTSTTSSCASAASTIQSTASTAAATSSTTAIIMKHRRLKERTFSEEIGSPKSPAATSEVVDDRKALRDALYQGIFHRHRRTIFAVGSFLRMLKSRNSSYNTIRSSSEGEDDTR
ncbi:mucin-5AC-like isoform X3 [Anopheles albimanus]|nr:mucin-5AC-like isoform X3 [Anopheles albimanus]